MASLQSVTVANVPADGSAATPITFPVAFTSSVGAVTFGISNYNGSDNASIGVPLIQGNPSLTGFTVMVSGGSSGSTVTLHYDVSGT